MTILGTPYLTLPTFWKKCNIRCRDALRVDGQLAKPASSAEAETMAADKQRWRRLLLALLAVSCLLCSSYFVVHASSYPDDNAGKNDRRGLTAENITSASIYKRVRIHREDIVASTPTIDDDNESGAENGGILSRDSQGLLVEIAHPIRTSYSQISSDMKPQTKIINGIAHDRATHPYIVRLHWFDPGDNSDNSWYTAFCGGV